MLRIFPQCFQSLSIAIGDSMQHTCDMADDSKFIMRMALNHARDQLGNNPKLAREVRDDMIARYVETHRAATGDKLKEYIVPAAAKMFGVSQKTVWNVLGARKRKKLQP
jgi:hypothetical protein